MGMSLEEATMDAHCCTQDHRKQGARGEDVSLVQQIWELTETALGSPFAESVLNFLGPLNQGVETQGTLLPNSF